MRNIYTSCLVRVIDTRSTSARLMSRNADSHFQGRRRTTKFTFHWCLHAAFPFKKFISTQAGKHIVAIGSTAVCTPARARLYTIVMYKVLRVNGQQTGREPRINERNFGTCGMPRFIRIHACSLVHASSAAEFTRVPFLLREGEKGEKSDEKQNEYSDVLSSTAR